MSEDGLQGGNGIDPPDIGNWMASFVSVRRSEYEEQFADEDSPDEINKAIDEFERFASELVSSGVPPANLPPALESFRPGDSLQSKILDLLKYQIVHHRLEFDVAEEVCDRLSGLDGRVQWVTVVTILLVGYKPSETALKYFQRATRLYLAGYESEAVILCGAVLEAALRARFPDEELKKAGIKPAFRRSNDYSVAQRLKFEESLGVLDSDRRQMARDLVNWRNDAVHVQPDIAPAASDALVNLAILLPKLLPEDAT